MNNKNRENREVKMKQIDMRKNEIMAKPKNIYSKEQDLNNNTATTTSHKEQLYQSIVQDIRNKYGNSLSELEVHQAARNLIEFVRELLK